VKVGELRELQAPLKERYRAEPQPNPEGHERIRRLLAEKYGWADWWVGLLQDTSGSIAIRLEPRA